MEVTEATGEGARDLLRGIAEDMKTLARDELELAQIELRRSIKAAVGEGAAIVLAGAVALIGLGLLCVTAVVALEPVIAALWLRLLIMAVVYLAAGGIVAAVFAKKLKNDIVPDLHRTMFEARRTAVGVREELRHA